MKYLVCFYLTLATASSAFAFGQGVIIIVPEGRSYESIRSDQAGHDLRNVFREFLPRHLGRTPQNDVEGFIVASTRILIRFPEHNAIARNYFLGENRLLNKILLGMICYVGDPNEGTVVHFLRDEGGFADEDFRKLDQVRME